MATVGVKELIPCFGHVTQQHVQHTGGQTFTSGSIDHLSPTPSNCWLSGEMLTMSRRVFIKRRCVNLTYRTHLNVILTRDRETAAHIYDITSISLLLTHTQQALSIKNNVFVCYISCFVRHGVSAMLCYSCFVFQPNQ